MTIILPAFLVGFFFIAALGAWHLLLRERARLLQLEKEHSHLRVRHQHACHLITVLQARLAARDAGTDRGPRWLPRT